MAGAWTVRRTPNPAGAKDRELFGVSCVSMAACTAVGYTNSAGTYVTLVERWNGSSCSVQQTPQTPAGRWNGTNWTVQRAPGEGR